MQSYFEVKQKLIPDTHDTIDEPQNMLKQNRNQT